MKQIKTVIRPISGATQFDLTINRLIESGWKLKERKVIQAHGEISESFNFPSVHLLYAELEKENTFEEVTL